MPASNDQVTALVNAYTTGNRQFFRAITLQIAGNNAERSPVFADRLRKLLERDTGAVLLLDDVRNMFRVSEPVVTTGDLVLASATASGLRRVVGEHERSDELSPLGLEPCRKLLFVGPPGVGKTMAAAALANALKLPLLRVQHHALIASHLGETAANLAKIFQTIGTTRGVYLFDEADALAADRTRDNDMAEMRRVTNSLLMLIDDDISQSVIVACTNLEETLDRAVFRRFDVVVRFGLPSVDEIAQLVNAIPKGERDFDGRSVADACAGASHADVVSACKRARKVAVLRRESVNPADIVAALRDRDLERGP